MVEYLDDAAGKEVSVLRVQGIEASVDLSEVLSHDVPICTCFFDRFVAVSVEHDIIDQ